MTEIWNEIIAFKWWAISFVWLIAMLFAWALVAIGGQSEREMKDKQ